jgi:hypothetical protein
MSIVVFLGPSLPLDEARRCLDATYLPPCAMGDLYAALQAHKPRAVGIIDGLFECTPAVWHKEILYALSQGAAVFGGASMGALRATELAEFGMQGVGRIYEDFHAGKLEDDDEVAVSHLDASGGYRSLSEPMVNLRYGLELARAQGILGAQAEQRLIAAMKGLYYPERSWQALLRCACEQGLAAGQTEDLRLLVEHKRPDRKREDALAVLQTLGSWRPPSPALPKTAIEFEPTLFWEHLVACRGSAASTQERGDPVSRERLIDHVRMGAPDRNALLSEALLLELAEQASHRLGLPPVDDRAALARFRRERGLNSAAALQEWMAGQGVDQAHCLELARVEERLRALQWRLQEQVNRQLPRVLQLRGRFDATVAAVQDQWRLLHGLGIDTPAESDVESMDTVLQWYQDRLGAVHGELASHVVERGFGSPRQFMAELLAQYLVHRHTRAHDARR